jgi:hypothetical protein
LRFFFASSRRRVCAVVVSIFLSALPAAGEDYPYSGLFWAELDNQGSDRMDLRCALSFIEQRKDGDWFVYHIDLDEFRKTGTAKYRQLANGHCTFDATNKVEACTTTMDRSYPEGEGTTVFDVILSVEDSEVDTVLFQDQSQLSEGLSSIESLKSGVSQTFVRCPFPPEDLLSLRVQGLTDLSQEDLNILRFPSDELLSDPTVAALVAKLKAQ